MAYPSVTNTFVNGPSNIIDAGEVNTNFQDLVSGISDGSKDVNMSAAAFTTLAVSGVGAVNGVMTMGASATVASSLSVGTSMTIGTTLAVTTNATVGGTLAVTGATTMSSTLAVTGVITATAGVSCGAGTGISVPGNIALGGTMSDSGNTTVINFDGSDSYITLSGQNGKVYTTGSNGDIYTTGSSAQIYTTGITGNIFASSGSIYTAGGSGHIFASGGGNIYATGGNLYATAGSIYAPAGDIYRTKLTDVSSTVTVTGWASYTDKTILYKQVGTTTFVWVYISGTSNANTATITLPATADALMVTPDMEQPIQGVDDGSEGYACTSKIEDVTHAYFSYNGSFNSWVTSGTKSVKGLIVYEAA